VFQFDVLLKRALGAVTAITELCSTNKLALNFLSCSPHPFAVFPFGVVVSVFLEFGFLIDAPGFVEIG